MMNNEPALQEKLHELGIALHACLDKQGRKEHLLALRRLLSTLTDSARASSQTEPQRRAGEAAALVDAFIANGAGRTGDIARMVTEVQILLYGTAAGATPVAAAASQPAAGEQAVGEVAAKTVYLLNDNPLLAKDTALQLQCFGYQVVVVEEWERLAALTSERRPSCVIIDVAARDGGASGAVDIALVRSGIEQQVPVLQVSTRSNFEARLAAARAGVDGYFVKPLDVVALIDRLDALTVRKEARPYRVLMIGNDTERLDGYGGALVDAGMEVLRLQRLIDIFRTLSQYRPELIVMDVHTPVCTGTDLTALIRQDKTWLDVPIILLSDDDDPKTRRAAIRAGADDFLLRPSMDDLVFSLSARVERYRALRGLILRDGLTGLYNHSATKEHLVREVARSKRDGTPLALAMVDIDFFKKVNDTYGHPVGDQVIRAISRLLQQRLRHGDVVGRYGGEEFAVILPATSAAAAQQVLDEIRKVFQKIRHKADDREFSATFSAGVAELADAGEAGALFRIADVALYHAKQAGRNRVAIAQHDAAPEEDALLPRV